MFKAGEEGEAGSHRDKGEIPGVPHYSRGSSVWSFGKPWFESGEGTEHSCLCSAEHRHLRVLLGWWLFARAVHDLVGALQALPRRSTLPSCTTRIPPARVASLASPLVLQDMIVLSFQFLCHCRIFAFLIRWPKCFHSAHFPQQLANKTPPIHYSSFSF